ncbi:response regulator [Chitinophaga horti]|uniref:histidine kinase n=1 Tax=Chitinophaga horti TaxID=2920382 RepID=A0ABY6IXH2_9BACT|nr:hybrid sensor histidine kinase/response regulator transcription factor [Chitinophaga horti]UYQ92089.1 response regulator [Chitinophaga horti]
MIFRRMFLVYLLIAVAFSTKSRAQTASFQHLTVEDGLSHNAVLAITQDSQGFLWLGTRYGLSRYDGQRFKIYRTNPEDSTSLPDNQVVSLYIDKQQQMWVGTTAGVSRFNPVTGKFTRVSLYSGRQTNINCIYQDTKGQYWFGGNNGLYVSNGTSIRKLEPPQLAGWVIRAIYEDRSGSIWIATNTGLSKITGEQVQTFHPGEGALAGLSMNFITAIAEDPSGKLWIGTQTAGIDIYDPATGKMTHLGHPGIVNNIVRRIVRDREGKMWVGTQEGLSIIDPATMQQQSYQHEAGNIASISQNSIHSMYEDGNGSMWLGTYFGGVNMSHRYGTAFTAWQNTPRLNGVSNNVISNMLEDAQHNLWIGTEGGGLNYLDRKTGKFTWYKHDPTDPQSLGSNLVKVVYEDKDHHIWIGTHGGGLNLLLPNGRFRRSFYSAGDPSSFSREITAMLEDSKGRFWAGANDRLHLLHRRGEELVKEKDSSLISDIERTSIRALLEDAKGRIWIGTISGIYILNGDSLQRLQPGYVNAIQQDSRHNIWISMYYGGLIRYNKNLQEQRHYTEKDGLPNSNVLGLLEDAQHLLWISTDNGLVKFDPDKNTFQTYTVSDGIAGNVFNYNSFLKDSRGELLFGGYNGITSFYPERLTVNNHKAPIRFTGLKLFNNPVGIGDASKLLEQDIAFTKELRFRPNQEVFTLDFALLNFVKSNKNRYAYRLEGADRDWIETAVPSVTYTNLSSGQYTFWVKAANNDGVWSEPVSIDITVLPPFWRTWWAYSLYAIVVALLVFGISRFFFLRALLRKEEELHQVKLNFFTHISHEIRTHLTLLMAPVEKMLDDNNTTALSQMRSNADRLLKLVSELMDFRKAESGHLTLRVQEQDLISFLDGIYTSYRELSLERNISISFTHDIENVPLYFDPGQLEKVFFNLLGNAFKFTPAGGRIQLHVATARNSVTVTVTDNGRGIAADHLDNIFSNFFQVQDHGVQNTGYGIGLALSRHIVEQHKGRLEVSSEPPTTDKEGRTTFTVTLLQGKRHFEGTQHVIGETVQHEHVAPIATTDFNDTDVAPAAPGDATFTIHIVEDNPELRALVRDIFRDQYHILESANGADGLQLAGTHIPDLVISDVMMPDMDGLQLCQALKTDERTSHIPVVLLTAKSSQADHVSGLETGADLYLTKPFSAQVLSLNVRNLLASREKMRERFSHQLQAAEPAPIAVAEAVPNSVDTAFLEKVMALVEEYMDDPDFGVDMLAKKVAMSQPVLYKKLKAVTNMSVNDFIKSLRLKKAAELIRTKKHTVYQVAYMVGYSDSKYFSREFRKQFGKTPTEYAGQPEL